jgi:hypothetical protein
MPEKRIFDFLQEHESLIKKRSEYRREIYNKNIDVTEYSAVLIFGERKKIVFSQNTKKVALAENEIAVPAKYYEQCLGVMKNQHLAQTAVKKFLISAAFTYFEGRLKKLGEEMGLRSAGLRVTDAKTLWGSCTLKGIISFNFRAVMLERAEIDYLIIHELCHLKYMNHSREFWKKVAEICPDYKKLRSCLKQKNYLQELFR